MASCKGTIDWQTGVDWGQVRPYGRGPLCAGLLGCERRLPRGGIRHQAGRVLRGRPASRGEKKQEVEAHVRRRELPGVPPADEARGLLGVLGGHHQGVRLLRRREEPVKPRRARRSASRVPASRAPAPFVSCLARVPGLQGEGGSCGAGGTACKYFSRRLALTSPSPHKDGGETETPVRQRGAAQLIVDIMGDPHLPARSTACP